MSAAVCSLSTIDRVVLLHNRIRFLPKDLRSEHTAGGDVIFVFHVVHVTADGTAELGYILIVCYFYIHVGLYDVSYLQINVFA